MERWKVVGDYKYMQLKCLITLGPIILWQRCHAAIASIQTLFLGHLSKEIALTLTMIVVLPGQIVAVLIVIVSGRCLLFVRPRCGSTGDNIACHKWHEFNRTDFSGVHFLGVLILQHPLDDVQPQSARRRDAQIVIQGKVLIFARSKCN